MTTTTTSLALTSYRHLLRSIHTAFANDTRTLHAALLKARTEYDSNRTLPSSPSPLTDAKIKHANDVADFLRMNVVQGIKEEKEGGGGEGEGVYKLRIHEGIERGDNESIKQPVRVKQEEEETVFKGRVGRVKKCGE